MIAVVECSDVHQLDVNTYANVGVHPHIHTPPATRPSARKRPMLRIASQVRSLT